MARWAWVGGILGVAAGAIAFAPAAWLAGAVAAATGAQVQLADARGSVWRGGAQLVLAGGPGSRDALALPGRFEWDIGVGAAGLQLRVQARCCTKAPLQLELVPAWSGLVLRFADGDSQWPAGLLVGLGAPWNTIQPQGLLHFRSERLSMQWSGGRVDVAGAARVEAIGMSTNLSTLRPIGSYRLSLLGGDKPGSPRLQLQTLDGSLQLSGSGQWSGSRWTFRGEASATPDAEPVLGNLLNMIGRREGAKSIISMG